MSPAYVVAMSRANPFSEGNGKRYLNETAEREFGRVS